MRRSCWCGSAMGRRGIEQLLGEERVGELPVVVELHPDGTPARAAAEKGAAAAQPDAVVTTTAHGMRLSKSLLADRLTRVPRWRCLANVGADGINSRPRDAPGNRPTDRTSIRKSQQA